MAGSGYDEAGSTEYLCLHEEPQFLNTNHGLQPHRGRLYGTEYETHDNPQHVTPQCSMCCMLAKTNLQDLARLCKIVQESCKNLDARLAWHVHRRDMSLSCTILAQFCTNSCKIVQEMQVIILAATLAKSCTISCKICARLCKNRARKGHIAPVHVPSKSCIKILARFLHDLASSFLLGS